MADKVFINRSGKDIFGEEQIFAEKKWIVQTLAKIRHQRNCIQIERLHLDSSKAKLRGGTKANVNEVKASEPDTNVSSTSAVNLMQCAPKSTEHQVSGMGVTDEEIICNATSLDLMIDHCVFSNGEEKSHSYNIEEDEEDDDQDIMIDMNMLMNGDLK